MRKLTNKDIHDYDIHINIIGGGNIDGLGNLYRLIMGAEPQGITVLEISYSVGLSLGILVFFNHFASWKITVDPTPIEVEMRLYEENLDKALIQNAGRKEAQTDVR